MISVLWRVGKKKTRNCGFGRRGIFFFLYFQTSCEKGKKQPELWKKSVCAPLSAGLQGLLEGEPPGRSWWVSVVGTGEDGQAERCIWDHPRHLLQRSSSSHTGGGEGAGDGVKPMSPIIPHSTDWDISGGHAGNGERVLPGDETALGKLHGHPTSGFFKLVIPLGRGRSKQGRMLRVGCPLWGYKPHVPRDVS